MRASLALIVAAAVALSLLWSQLVPVFQSPDEYAHFDYAFSLSTTGHLLSAGDARRPADYSPNAQALARAVDLGRIAFHSEERVALPYGTPAHRAALNAISSRAPAGYYDGPAPARSVLNAVYPPGYYVVAAAGMRLAGLPGAGMLHVFRAARLVSIALFVIGILAWYGALRETHLSPLHSLFVAALVGLAPLTSFVSSYVQPDNLAWTTCALTAWTALRTRRQGGRASVILWYGLALGATCFAKYQFGLVMAVATLPVVIPAIARTRIEGAAKVGSLLLAVGPALLAVGIAQWSMSGSTTNSYLSGQQTLTSAVSNAFMHGKRAGVHFLLAEVSAAFRDLFLAPGMVHVSFWGDFGWLDTALSSGQPTVDTLAGSVLAYGTLLMIGMATIALARNAARVARIMRRRGAGNALAVVFGDPIVNAYYVFVVLIFSLHVLSSNLFGAQGRDFYPFEMSAFLVVTRYAPKALPWRRWRRIAAATGGLALALFVGAYGVFAVTSIENRYYGPPDTPGIGLQLTHLVQGTVAPLGHVDDAVSIAAGGVKPLGARPLLSPSRIFVRGWALDPSKARPPKLGYLTVDGRVISQVRTGIDRPDVAAALHTQLAGPSGYLVTLDAAALRPGHHHLWLLFTNADGDEMLRPVTLPSIEVPR